MTITNSSIGHTQAFPWQHYENSINGMTYRQWLIGQALAGLSGKVTSYGQQSGLVAKLSIIFADQIIERLEKEAKENESEF